MTLTPTKLRIAWRQLNTIQVNTLAEVLGMHPDELFATFNNPVAITEQTKEAYDMAQQILKKTS